ncbi:YbhB/YbcL family Raf kinase inhibitor-like protein [Candidatus Binatus sp.]|uniref:YbhB/YbcL family Raf kinase inhibitor-like protein n=1 Tax=Candidatus Binatus sp. TaxID=2811406 RepID=UPI003CC65089
MGVKNSLRGVLILFVGFPCFTTCELTYFRRNFDAKCTSKPKTAPASFQVVISMPNLLRISIALTLIFFAHVCQAQAQLTLSTAAFAPDASISAENACTGDDHSPALVWSNAPQATKSFSLIVEDPDAPGGTFIHWVAYNIPAQTNSLPAGVPQTTQIAGGGKNGINGFDHIGYNGPCPPPGKIHHYHFRLFALDSALNPADKAGAAAVESAMKGHVLATAELVGTFER